MNEAAPQTSVSLASAGGSPIGRATVTVVPTPSVLAMVTSPPCWTTMRRTPERPVPAKRSRTLEQAEALENEREIGRRDTDAGVGDGHYRPVAIGARFAAQSDGNIAVVAVLDGVGYAGGGFCPALSCGIGSSGVPEGAVSENGRFRQGVGDHPRGRPPPQRATLSARHW